MIELVQQLRDHRTSDFDMREAAWKAADRIEKLERENAALEKRLQEIQRMCLGYQEEHAGLRKSLDGWNEYARKSGLAL